MPRRILFRDRIRLKVRTVNGPRILLDGENGGAVFSVGDPGVVSLAGANQSGKTLLIRLLIGAIRTSRIDRTRTVVDGEPISIGHVRDATRAGLVAVFDQEQLLSSFTVRDQVLLRHLRVSSRRLAWAPADLVFHATTYIDSLARSLGAGTDLSDGVERLVERLVGANEAHRILREANVVLDKLGFSGLLDFYPRELSKGAAAAVRIAQALLTPKLRVLFLDEALSGVSSRDWPRIVDYLLEWQVERQAAIVVVTHNIQELVRWSPTERYEIVRGRLLRDHLHGYRLLVPSIPARTQQYPVYEYPWPPDARWLNQESDCSAAIVIVDRSVRFTRPFLDLLSELGLRVRGGAVEVIEFAGGEANKSIDRVVALASEIAGKVPGGECLMAIVGGGVTLNAAGFAAAVVGRGRHPLVIVPTTLMAIADVAVGSKVSANSVTSASAKPRKHAIGVYANPNAVLVDGRFLDSLPDVELLHGLSECIKHAILQDAELLTAIEATLGALRLNRQRAYDIAMRVMRYKARLLTLDAFEKEDASMLLFGHQHAHALERASDFTVPHGSSVFFGLLVDLQLAGAADVYSRVAGIVHRFKAQLCGKWNVADEATWKLLYDFVSEEPEPTLRSLRVPEVGCYASRVLVDDDFVSRRWSQVWEAIVLVREEVLP